MAQNPKPNNFKKPNNKRSSIITIVVFVVIALFFMTMVTRMTASSNGITQTDQLVTSEFMQAVDQGRVQSVVYDSGSDTITGTYYPASTAGSAALDAFNVGIEALNSQLGVMKHDDSRLGIVSVQDLTPSKLGSEHNFVCTWVGQDSLGELMAAHPEINYRVNLASPWGSILLSLLPIILIAAILFFFFSQMNKANNSQMSFGKARAKKSIEEHPDVKFSDVAGVDEAVEEMQEVKDFLSNPAKYQSMGAKIPRGCLLVGPPGTGKTLLARAVAGEAKVPFFSISGSDFVEMFVGVGASRVRDLFKQAKDAAPSIIFIDEIDAVGRQRGAGLGGGHDEREQTLNQLLVEMDGFEPNDSVVLIAATNRSDVLDPALLRPGRFDRQIVVDVPDVKGREKILKVHAENKPMADDVNLSRLAKLTPGFTGADLANLLNESAILAARRNKTIINDREIQESMERVIAGPERKGRILDAKTKSTIAFHESGHALVGHTLEHADPVHKISIISRGRALGYTLSIPEDDKPLNSRNEMRDQLAVLLGGRVAEEIFCEDITTGASNDLERATKIARSMITNYGMSSELGVQIFGQPNHEVFLGRDYGNTQDYSEETARRIDDEVARLMKEAHDRAYEVLSTHTEQMKLMASVLLERETVDGEACTALLDNRWAEYLQQEQAKAQPQDNQDGNNQNSQDGQPQGGSYGQNAQVPQNITNGQPSGYPQQSAPQSPAQPVVQQPTVPMQPVQPDQPTQPAPSVQPAQPAQEPKKQSEHNSFLGELEQKIKDLQNSNQPTHNSPDSSDNSDKKDGE